VPEIVQEHARRLWPRLRGRRAWRRLLAALLVANLLLLTSAPAGSHADEAPEPPQIFASAAVVLSDFNQVLYAQNEHLRAPQASTTKMMTAIVAVRYGDLNMQVLVQDSDLVGESTMGLQAGETLTLHDLLYGLLLPSGNDAATAIARSVGYRQGDTSAEQSMGHFIDLMNQTAQEYGLQDTHFVTPHGLDAENHYSSAYDLAIILRAALNYPAIRDIMGTRSYNAAGHDLYNGDHLFDMRDDVLGGKTGFTDAAGFCLAGAAKQGNRFAIAVVMNDDGDNWVIDTSNLLDYGLATELVTPLPKYVDPALVGTQFSQSPELANPHP
jgi:D-alanyl-D-alanine carboxypeptidase (penicillin-binding protein 5/6)